MTAFVFLADGFEDIEAIAVIDILRRAGVDVKTVSVNDEIEVRSAHGVTMLADTLVSAVSPEADDMLILPGGMPGTTHLGECAALCDMLVEHNNRKGHIAAICAAPSVLGNLGILEGHEATCYPGIEGMLHCEYKPEDAVVVSDNIITSCGPGQAMNFALMIVGTWVSYDVMQLLTEQMQF